MRRNLLPARRVSPHEVWVRGTQAFWKRFDGLRARFGIHGPSRVETAAAWRGAFFFTGEERHAIVQQLQLEMFADQRGELIRRADRILAHRFDLLAYPDLFFGEPIDWHLDPVHDKRTPLLPWYQVRYLDPEQVGDAKIVWELNRHQHLVTLARAYLLTRERRYADEAFAQWYAWQQGNPYPFGINWASSLEVALRSLAWLWLWALLRGEDVVPRGFDADLATALALNARHIHRYLSTYFSPNTHLLGEAVALFAIGTVASGLRHAPVWRREGWRVIVECAERHVRRDGFYFEQSTYYHVYALDFLLHARTLAARNGIEVPPAFDSILQRMLEALATLAQAGAPPRFGDDDGGRVFDPTRNRAEHLADPLATGAVLFERADLAGGVRHLPEETLWLLGPAAVGRFQQLASARPPSHSAALAESGFYVLAGGDWQITVDAGPQGTGRGGHGHADALSLTVNVDGQPVLIDPGTFSYLLGEGRNDFRGTRAHNTLVVGGCDQAMPADAFGWQRRADANPEFWAQGDGYAFLRASHQGYAGGSVVHCRSVFQIAGRWCLICDDVLGEGTTELESWWHLAPGIEASQARDGITELRFAPSGTRALTLLASGPSPRVDHGWWSPAYGLREPAPVLRAQSTAALPSSSAWLLAAGPQQLAGQRLVRAQSCPSGLHAYNLSVGGTSYFWFVAAGAWRWEGWASDAAALYGAFDSEGHAVHVVVCGGTFVEMAGDRVWSAAEPAAGFEWRRECASAAASPADAWLRVCVPGRGYVAPQP